MKASFITGYGGPEVIRFGELPDPVVEKGKVLVRVRAVSINALDYKIRNGVIRLITGSKFPKVLGIDFSGIILETGGTGGSFRQGDRVYGAIPPFFRKPGALSELIRVSPKLLRKMPDAMNFEEAASLPVASLTALNGLNKGGNLHGKDLLVIGANGGIGHFAVQIGRAWGARVTAACSAKNRDLALQLGAMEVVGYSEHDLAQLENRFDVVLDAYGKINQVTFCRLLKKNGVGVSTVFLPPAMVLSLYPRIFLNKKITGANFSARPEDYQEIETLFAEGRLRPCFSGIFPPEETRQAFEMVEQGKVRGKVIVRWD